MTTPRFLLGAFTAAAILGLTAPAKSALYPNIYAATFCDLVYYGVSEDAAHTSAAQAAFYSANEPKVMGPNGTPTTPSVLLATRAVMNRCGKMLIKNQGTQV